MTHTENRPYKCDICEYTFVSRAHLIYHKSIKHKIGTKTGKKKFKTKNNSCNFCEQKFDSKLTLEDHTNKVHLKNPLFCECGRKFYTKYRRDYHVRTAHNQPKKEIKPKVLLLHKLMLFCSH